VTESIENLILEHLKRFQAGQERIEHELKEVKYRLTGVERGIAGFRRDSLSTQEDVYGQQAAIDHLKERLQRIEKRLELAD
jgi:chromosome segregation ATPase